MCSVWERTILNLKCMYRHAAEQEINYIAVAICIMNEGQSESCNTSTNGYIVTSTMP